MKPPTLKVTVWKCEQVIYVCQTLTWTMQNGKTSKEISWWGQTTHTWSRHQTDSEAEHSISTAQNYEVVFRWNYYTTKGLYMYKCTCLGVQYISCPAYCTSWLGFWLLALCDTDKSLHIKMLFQEEYAVICLLPK